MTPKLDFDTRALTPIDVFHFLRRQGEFSLQMPLYQYRKWAISCCCRRLSAKIATWRSHFSGGNSRKIATGGTRQLSMDYYGRVNYRVLSELMVNHKQFLKAPKKTCKYIKINKLHEIIHLVIRDGLRNIPDLIEIIVAHFMQNVIDNRSK